MTTTVIIPAPWMQTVGDLDINAWFAARGGTVLQRERSRVHWKITLAEDLNQTQKDNLATLIENKFNKITFEGGI